MSAPLSSIVHFLARPKRRQCQVKVLSVIVAAAVLLSASACHSNTPGQHTGLGPQAIELTATLVGAAAEVGALALTKNHVAATLTSVAAGAGAKYVIEQMGLSCKVCGTTSPFNKLAIGECEPSLVSCGNPACQRSAYLVASYSEDHLKAILQQLKETLEPTCLLTKETIDDRSVKLTWYSHNSSSASLNGESVPLGGSTVVSPEQTTTYVLKVIGKYGKSEDSVIVEVAPKPPPPASEPPVTFIPPAPPVTPTPPTEKRTPVAVYLNKILVNEDGSVGATDWSFSVYLGEANLIAVPRQSYHDDDRNAVQFSRLYGEGIVPGNDIRVKISGYSFDTRMMAEGDLVLSLDSFAQSVQKSVQVAVPGNFKKGNFIFTFTIVKPN